MVRAALAGIAFALLFAMPLKPQSPSLPGPSPLELSLKPTGQQRQVLLSDPHSDASAPTISVSAPELSVDIRNISDKCVVAVGLSFIYRDSEGKPGATGYESILRQQNGQLNCLEAGQTDNLIVSGNAFEESLRPMTPEVSVDFVIFGDGSTWGPGKDLEQKGYLRGKFDAYKHIQMEKNKKPCSSPTGAASTQQGPG
jgi:hypothetical protein